LIVSCPIHNITVVIPSEAKACPEMRKERGHTENLFMLMIFGDIVGLPLLPPCYSLRLFPYIIHALEDRKRRVLREKDLTDFVAGDL